MKKQDLNTIKTNSPAQLRKLAKEIESEKMKLNLEAHLAKNKNVHISMQKRRDLAKVMTILNQKLFEEKLKKPEETKKA